MKSKLIDGVWHIKRELDGKMIKMTPKQLHDKIEALYLHIKRRDLLIEAQTKKLNEI